MLNPNPNLNLTLRQNNPCLFHVSKRDMEQVRELEKFMSNKVFSFVMLGFTLMFVQVFKILIKLSSTSYKMWWNIMIDALSSLWLWGIIAISFIQYREVEKSDLAFKCHEGGMQHIHRSGCLMYVLIVAHE